MKNQLMDIKDLQSTNNGIIISHSSVVTFSLRRSKRYQWIKRHLNGELRKKLKLYSNKIFYGSLFNEYLVCKGRRTLNGAFPNVYTLGM